MFWTMVLAVVVAYIILDIVGLAFKIVPRYIRKKIGDSAVKEYLRKEAKNERPLYKGVDWKRSLADEDDDVDDDYAKMIGFK